jgi:hypothetical protein
MKLPSLHPLTQRSLVERLRNRQADPIALLTQREPAALFSVRRALGRK